MNSSICVDIDECADDADNDCEGLCINTAGSYVCSCDPGYRLGSDERTCHDVNECAEHSDGCEQRCNNTVGSFHCLCEEGYTLKSDNKSCIQDSNLETLCKTLNCTQGCRDKEPGALSAVVECFCFVGYELDLSDNRTCQDVDECGLGLCAQECVNTVGSFNCSCYSGFQLNEDRRTCSQCTGERTSIFSPLPLHFLIHISIIWIYFMSLVCPAVLRGKLFNRSFFHT